MRSIGTPMTDPVDRAHLTGRSTASPVVPRYPVAPDLVDLARRFWTPTWDVPPGEVNRQRVLQYPVCLVVVTRGYARLYGVTTGLSTTDLSGRGWALGLMLQPAAGRMLWHRPVSTLTDRFVDLTEVPGLDGEVLTGRVRALLSDDPVDQDARRRAMDLVEEQLRVHLPVDDDDRLVNDVVARVEGDPTLVRVDDLARSFALGERTLQRLTRDRIGVSPKWLIQRRRLHDAAERLKSGPVDLAQLALDLGYVDQAHFTRDWSRVTGSPPGAYRADQPHAVRDDASEADP